MRAPDRVVEAVSIRSRLFSREILAARPVSSEDGKFQIRSRLFSREILEHRRRYVPVRGFQSAPGFLAGRYHARQQITYKI